MQAEGQGGAFIVTHNRIGLHGFMIRYIGLLAVMFLLTVSCSGGTPLKGGSIPSLTSAGTDQCDDRFTAGPWCVELLSYEGVIPTMESEVIETVNALAKAYPNDREDVTFNYSTIRNSWDGRSGEGGDQTYVGIMLWHPVHSNRERILTDLEVILGNNPEKWDRWLTEHGKSNPGGAIRSYDIWDGNGSLLSFNWEIANNERTHSELRKVAGHEWFHLYSIQQVLSLPCCTEGAIRREGPKWIKEGTAEYATYRVGATEFIVR